MRTTYNQISGYGRQAHRAIVRKFCVERLNAHGLFSFDDARVGMEDWRLDCKDFRPNRLIGNQLSISLMNGSAVGNLSVHAVPYASHEQGHYAPKNKTA